MSKLHHIRGLFHIFKPLFIFPLIKRKILKYFGFLIFWFYKACCWYRVFLIFLFLLIKTKILIFQIAGFKVGLCFFIIFQLIL